MTVSENARRRRKKRKTAAVITAVVIVVLVAALAVGAALVAADLQKKRQAKEEAEAAAAAEKKKRRRREEDVRSASLAPVAELGRARAATAGRPLPLAAEEGTVFRVGAADTRRRPATAKSALPPITGKRVRLRALRNRCARESSVSDRDFSKPGGARERTSKSAGGALTLRSPGLSW